jgi:hypothetical protein
MELIYHTEGKDIGRLKCQIRGDGTIHHYWYYDDEGRIRRYVTLITNIKGETLYEQNWDILFHFLKKPIIKNKAN